MTNPLTGKTGASYIFGSQKGATDEMIKILDFNLKHFANVVKEISVLFKVILSQYEIISWSIIVHKGKSVSIKQSGENF